MAGLFDVDLIPKILSVDKKVRLSSEIGRRGERRRESGREDRSKRLVGRESEDADPEKEGTVDITV